MRDEQGAIPGLWYALLALTVVLVAVTGWLGFLIYPRMGLPAVEGAALLVLASAAGVAAFFSPCSFPLLATILSREIGAERPAERRARAIDALRFALALSVGAGTFLVLVGLAVAAGSGGLLRGVTFGSDAARLIRIGAGTILVALGLVQIGVIHVPAFHQVDVLARPLQRRQAELRRGSASLGYAVFGFGYILAGFG
jgi:cytochrome c biogenesis protein CcdA